MVTPPQSWVAVRFALNMLAVMQVLSSGDFRALAVSIVVEARMQGGYLETLDYVQVAEIGDSEFLAEAVDELV